MLAGITGSFKAGRRALPQKWDPSRDITTQLWIDASDTSSYSVGGGNNLNSLTDKAGNNTLGFTSTPQRAHNALNNMPAFYANGSESIQTVDGSNNAADATVTDGSGNHWAIGVVLSLIHI